MRYYTITVLNTDGSVFQQNGAPVQWTSFVNGQSDLGALQVEIDAPVSTLANPLGAAAVTVWGVPLQMIGQAADFNGKNLKVEAGFKPGLPLATAAAKQAGVIMQGAIQQAFGNWIGVNQWLRFIVTSDGGNAGQALNISFNWLKGTPLSQALQQTLATALPGCTVKVNVNPSLVLGQDQPGAYQNLRQFAQYLKQATIPIVGGTYQGVDLLVSQTTITATDGTAPATPKQLAFTDLIGQPTWIDPATVQITTSMRADLQPTGFIKLPPTQVTIAPGNPLVGVQDKSVFQGSFGIKEMRHIGNFRQPDALAWVTIMNCYPSGS